ncbi:hypothetical protein [Corynebacterium liangguodongii]|uniref:Uncharacterized protein n=1 Tax=Corynebacterium liangguodongii TaxID=2079535 RepID=A0A2S0WGM6_9CORY|nr:hypothetical protein [Corynebacterium liangguodongii]AWB84920.1 hypothetical protein C3E79_10930 [Corynebacterium liangguodongii]PWB99372.1 hypothetical protein DF219_07345 [Corynebacterium liangguodongii]
MTVVNVILALSFFAAAWYWWWTGVRAERGTLRPGTFCAASLGLSYFDKQKWVEGHYAASGYTKAVSVPLFVAAIACLFAGESVYGWIFVTSLSLAAVALVAAVRKAHAAVRHMP